MFQEAVRLGQPRYIVRPAVNKTRQCRGPGPSCACVLGLVSRERPRAFICLLAGPRINNAAIRTREERVKGGGEGGGGGGGWAGRGPSKRSAE